MAARRAARRRLEAVRAGRNDESGFSLIELVVVVAVLPIIVGAMTAALMSVISFQPVVSKQLSDSGDAQVLTTNFNKDVTGAAMVTGASNVTNPPPCGPGTQVLGLLYGSNGGTNDINSEISYSIVQSGNGTGTTYNLYRNVCQVTGTPPNLTNSLTSSLLVSHDVTSSSGSGIPNASVTCSSATAAACTGTPNWQTGWVSVAQILNVSLPLTYASSNYSQTPTAAPRAGINSGGGGSTTTPTYNCGFATAGTGTYASSLCFFDFTGWNTHTGATQCNSGNGYQLTDGITGTPFTMSFCVTVTGTSVAAASIPTYTDPPTSEAFLGNNGFYTGIPGNPALYQTGGGLTTVTISNISVQGTTGSASNWSLVTGDAESTDQGEHMTWTAGWNAGSSIPAVQQVLSPIPNVPGVSAFGNACANTTVGTGLNYGNGLTGLGTASVTCTAGVSNDKTGTVMLSAPAPNSLTTSMYGTGLEAMFIGILLPS